MDFTSALIAVLLIACIVVGSVIGWLWAKPRNSAALHSVQDEARKQFDGLQQEYNVYKATTGEQLLGSRNEMARLIGEKITLQDTISEKSGQMDFLKTQLATVTAELKAAIDGIRGKSEELQASRSELVGVRQDLQVSGQKLALAQAENRSLEDKLKVQLKEIEGLHQKFGAEFENVANRILETKSEKFTTLNKANIEAILGPLGTSINEFKEQVNKAYVAESNERFSLGERVKELANLNQQISQDAKNLTRALKGEAKTQGRWGEVMLETILEKSGLRKGEEYFMEYQLFDAEGRPLRKEARGSKMRPDALVMYPDDRHVIIDSKVSINAFVRLAESADPGQQQIELTSHVLAVKSHIQDLQSKAYDDYDKTLDFVMLFVPSEAAYIEALRGDPDLWYYAFDRRILLIGPSNLIISLKLIVDLWKREYQNKNAQAIAERGGKLYDKFVGFVGNLQIVGTALDSARGSYDEAFKQLSTGRDNLVLQATKLKNLGVKTGKPLPEGLARDAAAEEAEGEEAPE